MDWISVETQAPPVETPIWVWTDKAVESRTDSAIYTHAFVITRYMYAGCETCYIEHDSDGGSLDWYNANVTHWAYIVGPNGEVQKGAE